MKEELNSTSTFRARLGRAFVNFLRTLLVLIIIAGLIAAISYGTPYLYNKFILPVENNTSRLSEVESKQAADVNLLAEQINDLKTRLSDLELRQTENAQAMAEVQGQVDALETAVDTHTETLKQLETIQSNLDALTDATDEYDVLLVGENSALEELKRQVTLSRAIEMLSRARLFLSQSNFGLAKQDVQVAHDMLVTLQSDIPDEKSVSLQGVIARLEFALENLPAFPVVAVDDVDIAWQLLVNGLPNLPEAALTPDASSETQVPGAEVTPPVTPTP